jgi:integrative and conjugative element protein (TIGR02256 family)
MRLRGRVGAAWIPEAVLGHMEMEAGRRFPSETGGILMGYWAEGRDHEVVITSASGPCPAARHGTSGYIPDSAFDREWVARTYLESGRTHTYLGDWHVHPHGSPGLSSRDRRTLGRIARDGAARSPTPIMGVVAGGPSWELAIWRYRSRRWPMWGVADGSRFAPMGPRSTKLRIGR